MIYTSDGDWKMPVDDGSVNFIQVVIMFATAVFLTAASVAGLAIGLGLIFD